MQIEILRSHSTAQRMIASIEMADLARELVEQGVRLRHPHYSDKQVRLAMSKVLLPADLFEKAYPDAGDILS